MTYAISRPRPWSDAAASRNCLTASAQLQRLLRQEALFRTNSSIHLGLDEECTHLGNDVSAVGVVWLKSPRRRRSWSNA